MILEAFPKCRSYLAIVDRKALADPGMTDRWASVILGDAMSKNALRDAGVSFDAMDTGEILSRLEVYFGRKTPTGAPMSGGEMESLRAFFGSRGVRAALIRTDDDFWECATILWPRHIKRGRDLKSLLAQIRRMTKAQRRDATANISVLKTARPDLFRGAV